MHTEFRWKLLLECDDFDNDGEDRPKMVKKKSYGAVSGTLMRLKKCAK